MRTAGERSWPTRCNKASSAVPVSSNAKLRAATTRTGGTLSCDNRTKRLSAIFTNSLHPLGTLPVSTDGPPRPRPGFALPPPFPPPLRWLPELAPNACNACGSNLRTSSAPRRRTVRSQGASEDKPPICSKTHFSSRPCCPSASSASSAAAAKRRRTASTVPEEVLASPLVSTVWTHLRRTAGNSPASSGLRARRARSCARTLAGSEPPRCSNAARLRQTSVRRSASASAAGSTAGEEEDDEEEAFARRGKRRSSPAAASSTTLL
mmetsp:Transcript_13715/g.34421  ORF Transcript_13715/g.34421 Transcript_13715/m.34421 type:complete len:265 (+) Transcript_13715:1193-1987(+)